MCQLIVAGRIQQPVDESHRIRNGDGRLGLLATGIRVTLYPGQIYLANVEKNWGVRH